VTTTSLKAISPIDGRYQAQTAALADYFSEYALIRYRFLVEIRWLIALAERPEIPEVRPFTPAERALLESWIAGFSEADAARIKQIEQTTQHDVKAVEYDLQERLRQTSLAAVRPFVHFGCTSEDINNLAYALALKEGLARVWLPLAEEVVATVQQLAAQTRDLPMLARTHGQPATPTTLGKELAVFVARWDRQLARIRQAEHLGKFNGAVGTYSAHVVAYPDAPWLEIARDFVESLGLRFNPLTTQIEPHDYLAEIFHQLIRFNTIGLDFTRDVWSYISLGYFRQKVVAGEVGSSTMPHKVNPIHFENAEANFGISNALLDHLATKLPVSRLQRDLTDSSALRNVGVAIAHGVVALRSTRRGLASRAVDPLALQRDLDAAWSVLAEAIQTVMRKAGDANAYDRLKALTRGAEIGQEEIRSFIQALDLPAADKERLLALTPATYTGLAARLVQELERSPGQR
jgi:adenylosuccinate lyase